VIEKKIVLKGMERFGLFHVWCPFCNKMHTHGRGGGHRAAHCPVENNPEDYWIQEFTKKELDLMGLQKKTVPKVDRKVIE